MGRGEQKVFCVHGSEGSRERGHGSEGFTRSEREKAVSLQQLREQAASIHSTELTTWWDR
jgi:hypothetical protein